MKARVDTGKTCSGIRLRKLNACLWMQLDRWSTCRVCGISGDIVTPGCGDPVRLPEKGSGHVATRSGREGAGVTDLPGYPRTPSPLGHGNCTVAPRVVHANPSFEPRCPPSPTPTPAERA